MRANARVSRVSCEVIVQYEGVVEVSCTGTAGMVPMAISTVL